MTRLDKIKYIISLDKVPGFITDTKASVTRVESIYLSSKPDDVKVEEIFNVFVKYGLCNESVLNSVPQ